MERPVGKSCMDMVLCSAVILILISLTVPIAKGNEHEPQEYGEGIPLNNFKDRTIYLTDNITIKNGDVYQYVDTDIIFNCSYDGQIQFLVESGGYLQIMSSNLTLNRTGSYSNNNGFNYLIKVQSGGVLKLSHSNVSYAGYADGELSGVSILADDTYVDNTTFYSCYNGLLIKNSNRVVIDNCSFLNILDNGIKYIVEPKKKVERNVVKNSIFNNIINSAVQNGDQKYQDNNWNIYINNYFSQCKIGLNWIDSNFGRIENNSFIDCYQSGINVTAIYDFTVRNNFFNNCDIGLIIYSSNNITIVSNHYINCKNCLIYDNIAWKFSPFSLIENNRFEKSLNGLKIQGIRILVKDNNFFNIIKECIYGLIGFNYNPPNEIKIINNIFTHSGSCINLSMGKTIYLDNNEILNCTKLIKLDDINPIYIRNNSIEECKNGIKITNSKEIIINNNTYNKLETGLEISSCENLNIDKNKFIDVERGVMIRSSNIFNVEMNDHINGSSAIDLDSTARNGIISKNSFIGLEEAVIDGGSNSFDDGRYGNYWSDMDDYNDWDGDGIVDHPINIDVDSVDRYPLIVPWGQPWNRKIELDPFISDHRVEASRWLNLTFTASDPDGDEPFFELEPDREVDFELNNYTGEYSFRPEKEDVGFIEFNITVYDRNGTRDNGKFVVEVLYLNLPPVLEPVDNITTYPGIRVERELNYYDPNGDNVAVYVDSTNAPFRFSIKDNRYLVFTAGDDQTGVFWVKLTLSDGNGSQSHHIVNVFVIPYNVPPVIGDIFGLVAYVGETSSFELNVSDGNEDDLTISVGYDGNGSCWVEDMLLILRPDITDVGNRLLTVKVDDNNGSVENRSIAILVLLRNSAPLGPDRHLMRVEAGDVQTDQLLVVDLDGDTLSIASIEPKLDWVEVDFPDWFEVTAAPSLDEVGTKDFIINITDGRGGYLDIVIEIMVFAGPPPIINFTDSIIVKEKELSVYVLGTDYKKNGTIGFRVISDIEFVSLIENRLSFEPVHGDHGDYILQVETFVHRGSSRITNHTLRIDYDLSTLNITIKVGPEKEHYREGETLRISLTYSGYEADLDLKVTMETYPGGIGTIGSFEGKEGTFKLKGEGLFAIYVIINDHGYFGDPLIIKVGSVDGPNTPFYRFINIGIALLIAAGITIVGIAIYLRSRRGDSTDTTDDPGQESVYEGPDGPNGSVIDGTIPPSDVGPLMEGDNDQNIVTEGTGDVQEVPDLGSIEITSIMEGPDPTIPKPDGPQVHDQVGFK